jgi:hypothetical protein
MAQTTRIEGQSVEVLIDKLTALSSKRDAFEIIGTYLGETAIGINRKPFTYTTSFPKTDPGCTPKFARSFVHRDWRDGQDLVQAEQTAGEDGFNLRFHRLEQDLDALSDDVKKIFQCNADMRASIADLLGEIKAAINILQSDVARVEACCREGHATLNPDLLDVNPQGKLVGTVKWFGKEMIAFATPGGIKLLPHIGPVDGGPGDPRIKRVAALATLLAESKKVSGMFRGDSVRKDALVKKVGDEVADGYTLKELVDIVPDTARFSSADSLLNAVSEREAAAIRTSGRMDEVVASLGVNGGNPPADAKIEDYEALPEGTRDALAAAGVDTVGALAKAAPSDLATVLRREGITATVGAAAAWIAGAKTVTMIR